ILLAHQARHAEKVTPLYIRSGLLWEAIEYGYLQQYIRALHKQFSNIEPVVILEQPTADLYGKHWSTGAGRVPDFHTPDEAVYLPGRNLLLTLKGLLWCHLHGIKQLALGVLGSNPFPDASPSFFKHFSTAVGEGVQDHELEIITPFGNLHKVDVMKLGKDLPLQWSFSCIEPVGNLHCGLCNKCAERKNAFRAASLCDPTTYAKPSIRTAPCTV
ncbi:MAG TPA: 7-cyano-7-deazaguanine synthase, partial [Gemmatales bacterium]|nr:7-cyano-7-deazaguanine synthase [Gemmatales bacterium]